MRLVLVRWLAVAAVASLLLAVMAVPLGNLASGHSMTPEASMSMPCPSGSVCSIAANCSGICPATIQAEPPLRDNANLLRFHQGDASLLFNTLALDVQKPPPKLS
jgi:hypothetical protein